MTRWEKVQMVLALITMALIFAWAVIAIVVPHRTIEDFISPVVRFVLERFWH